jgi:hypothetical protein
MTTRLLVMLGLAACGGGGGATVDAVVTCSTDQECTAPVAVCDTQAMQCVQCTDVNAAACTGATPACAPDHTCHAGCRSDTDCASGACLGDGSCADPARLLWVARDVTGTTCTPADKCTLPTALALVGATRDIVHLDPLGYHFPTPFDLDRDVTIAGLGATLAVDQDAVFRIASQRVVTLDFLTLGGVAPALPNDGIDCTNATLTARQITVALTAGIGINASGCTLVLERATLHDNAGGGVLLGGGGRFTLTNNFIFRNGNVTSATCGGVELLGSVDPASRLELNTIVDNHASPGATDAGGVICNGATFTAPNNLIARNDVGGDTAASNAQTLGTCTYPTSVVQADVSGRSPAPTPPRSATRSARRAPRSIRRPRRRRSRSITTAMRGPRAARTTSGPTSTRLSRRSPRRALRPR